MDNKLHHLICTHCTQSSAAFQQSCTEEMASTAYGYSVRASSLSDLDELKNDYRSVEKLLSYGLPADATADDRTSRTAETAPKRQFYFPEINKRQVLGQIAYRPKDTTGRVGSYFAHLLVSRDTIPWDPLDCLAVLSVKKEGAASFWKDFDIDGPFPELVSADSLAALQVEEAKQRMDELVSLWLKGIPNELPSDSVAYEKSFTEWVKNYSAEGRMALVSSLSQRLIESNSPKSVILVTEPRVAAVIFYAALRILPSLARQRVSFSTFESEPLRSKATLVATTCFSSNEKLLEGLSLPDTIVGCEGHSGREGAQSTVDDTSDFFYYSAVCLRDNKLAAINRFLHSVDDACKKTKVDQLTSKMINGLFKINNYVANLFNSCNTQPKPLRNNSLPEPLQEFLIQSCLKFIASSKTRDNLGQEHSSKILPIIQGIFQTREDIWKRLQDNPKIGVWLQAALPTDESGVISVLCKPEQITSDRTALNLLKRFISKSGHLPSLEAERLWGNVKKFSDLIKSRELLKEKVGVVKASQWLLIRLLAELDNKGIVIVPKESDLFVYSAVTVAINEAIGSGGDSWESSAVRLLEQHLSQVLKEAAERIEDKKQFEEYLIYASVNNGANNVVNCSEEFLGRLRKLSSQLNKSYKQICTDGYPCVVLKPWISVVSAEDRGSLGKKIDNWKKILGWFAWKLEINSDEKLFASQGIPHAELAGAISEKTMNDKKWSSPEDFLEEILSCLAIAHNPNKRRIAKARKEFKKLEKSVAGYRQARSLYG